MWWRMLCALSKAARQVPSDLPYLLGGFRAAQQDDAILRAVQLLQEY